MKKNFPLNISNFLKNLKFEKNWDPKKFQNWEKI